MTTTVVPDRAVDLPAGTVRYADVGTGPPVVFVHAVLLGGALFRKVIPQLAGGHRCLVPDWPMGVHEVPMDPGADLSPPALADLVADFLEALDLEDVTLVGSDTGGMLVQLVATRRPERVGRIVLLPCDAYDVCPPGIFRYLKLVATIPGGLWLTAQAMRFRWILRLPIGFGWLAAEPPEREVVEEWYGRLRRSRGVRRDARKVLRGAHHRHTLEAAQRLAGFDRPALVAWSTDDRAFPRSLGDRLARDLPRARLEIVESSALISEDRPDELARLIATFVAEPSERIEEEGA